MLCAAVLPLAALTGHAADDPGELEVRYVTTRLEAGVWYVDARVEYRLSTEAREALANGVTLTFQLEIELARTRRWLPDDDIASLLQHYQLSYQALTERYVVRYMNSGEQSSHVTLLAALTELGRVQDLPLIDAALLEPNASYELAVRALLDQQTLPGPLQVLAFWDDGLSLESEWLRWRLGE
jgi:hypothetical protein